MTEVSAFFTEGSEVHAKTSRGERMLEAALKLIGAVYSKSIVPTIQDESDDIDPSPYYEQDS
ncbi:hypothetical protein BH09PAT2_BH09PAT2_06460 [soil metagenome]